MTRPGAVGEEPLCNLMLADVTLPNRGGALNLTGLLPPQDIATLTAPLFPGPERADLIAAYGEMADVFIPRARAMTERLGIKWPEAFHPATRRHLRERLKLVQM